MRKAILSEYHRKEGDRAFSKRLVGLVIFHRFGVDFEEFETGAGNFTTAIVELPDGRLKSVPVELVRFDPPTDVEPTP